MSFFKIKLISLLDVVKKMVVEKLRPKELARRLRIVPFLNLSKYEQEVITLQCQDTHTAQYIHPPTSDRLIGNVHFHFDYSFTKNIVKQYSRMDGAAGIQILVRSQVDLFTSQYLNATEPKPKNAYFFQNVKDLPQVSWEPPHPSQILSVSNDNEWNDDDNDNLDELFRRSTLKKFDI